MSVAFSLEKIDSMGEKSSLGEVVPLIKHRKARSLKSGEGVVRLVPGGYIHEIACRTAPRNLVTGNTGMAYIEQMVDEIGVWGQKSKNRFYFEVVTTYIENPQGFLDLHLPQDGTCPGRPRVPLPEMVDTGRVSAGL